MKTLKKLISPWKTETKKWGDTNHTAKNGKDDITTKMEGTFLYAFLKIRGYYKFKIDKMKKISKNFNSTELVQKEIESLNNLFSVNVAEPFHNESSRQG